MPKNYPAKTTSLRQFSITINLQTKLVYPKVLHATYRMVWIDTNTPLTVAGSFGLHVTGKNVLNKPLSESDGQ